MLYVNIKREKIKHLLKSKSFAIINSTATRLTLGKNLKRRINKHVPK